MPFDRLIDNIKAKNNPTVAGLDPKLSYLPAYLKENAYRNYGKTLEGAAAEQTALKAFGPLSAGKSWKAKPAGKTY